MSAIQPSNNRLHPQHQCAYQWCGSWLKVLLGVAIFLTTDRVVEGQVASGPGTSYGIYPNFCPLKYKDTCSRPLPNETIPSQNSPGWCYKTLYCNVNDKKCHRLRDTKEGKGCMHNQECRPYLFCKRSTEMVKTGGPGECVRWLKEGAQCNIEDGTGVGCALGSVCTADKQGHPGKCVKKWDNPEGSEALVAAQCRPWLAFDSATKTCKTPVPEEQCKSIFQIPFLHPPRIARSKRKAIQNRIKTTQQLSFYELCNGTCVRVLGTEKCWGKLREWDRFHTWQTWDARELTDAEFLLLRCLYENGLAGYYWASWTWSVKQIVFAAVAGFFLLAFIICMVVAVRTKDQNHKTAF
eukprot:TRINITY_DN97286_c0_g1_i1.p1 TRINITY_DN97286_c0_g1~~TRINITY_DN97286_c0_g1_i1.p1  ORF type:complete len:352 (-),score=20.49 TRINITY_DN97286_c0_g1_i1:131-1186(-)